MPTLFSTERDEYFTFAAKKGIFFSFASTLVVEKLWWVSAQQGSLGSHSQQHVAINTFLEKKVPFCTFACPKTQI